MRINKIASSHKISLALRSSLKKEAQPSLPSLDVCSLASFASKIQRNSFTSLDKQNKKQPVVAKPDSIKKMAKEPLKLRTYSTNPDLKPSHNSLVKLQQSKWPKKESTVQGHINQIVELLKKHYILTQNHANNYAIRKDNFLKLVRYFLLKDREGQQTEESVEFGYLDCLTEEVGLLAAEKARTFGQRRLKIASRVTSFVFNFEKYHDEVVRRTTEIEKLEDKKHSLLSVINQLESLTPTLANQYLHLQTEINQSSKILQEARADHAYLHNEKQALTKQIEECRKELEAATENSLKISNYINHQNNKLLVLASQEYKSIESDIYEYASYLQCNQLASSLAYEPLSITCLTNDLEDQLREVNRNLVQNEAMDAKEKGKAMRDFVLEWINRFKKKEEEQKEVIRFKTKCVINFIEKMKKWLENWTLKQEYLVGLRDEFSINTEKIKKLIAELTSCQSCRSCQLKNEPLTKALSMLYDKIETNYKLGNSFY